LLSRLLAYISKGLKCGWFLSHNKAKAENVKAMVDFAKKYGIYK